MAAERRIRFRWMGAYWSIRPGGWLRLNELASNYQPFDLAKLGAREITKPKGRVEQFAEAR